MMKISEITKFVFIKFLTFYKRCISPLLPHACRFQPTCSEYMLEAIKIHGVFVGFYLGIKRLLRCHPWGGSGFDPVPLPKNAKNTHKDSD